MKLTAAILALLACLGTAAVQAGDVPHAIAGFTLGQDIDQSRDRLLMDTMLPLRYQEYLKEVEIAPRPGFKSGLMTYGFCSPAGRLVRIKLKYADASRAFYDALLSRVERRFGKPTAYEGDPFHIVIEWKWSFIDADGSRITLHLSHNDRDEEEKVGNALKLTHLSALEEERRCFLDRQPQGKGSPPDPTPPLKSLTEKDWETLLPQ